MELLQGLDSLIKLPFQRYIEYLCLLHQFDEELINEDLYLIGYHVPAIKTYIQFYKAAYLGKYDPDMPQIGFDEKNYGLVAKYRKKGSSKKFYWSVVLQKAGFKDLYLSNLYYVRYILLHPRIRQMINELGMKGIDLTVILDIIRDWGNMVIPRDELKVYYKYFWDFQNMAIDDWYEFLETLDDLELRDRYVDILSNDSSYVLGEYDYTEDLDIHQIKRYTLKKIYLRFKQLIDIGENDEKIIRYANLLRQYIADETNTSDEANKDIRALMTLLGDAEVQYKDVEEIFQVEGNDTKALPGGQDTVEDASMVNIDPVKLPEE